MNPSGSLISWGSFATDSTSHCLIIVLEYFPPRSDSVTDKSNLCGKHFFKLLGCSMELSDTLGYRERSFLAHSIFGAFFWPSIARLCYRCSRSAIVCHTSSWLVHLVYFPMYCISSIIAVYPLPALLCHFLPSMTAISFDRYLALTLHLLYLAIITVNRVINFILLAFVFLTPSYF